MGSPTPLTEAAAKHPFFAAGNTPVEDGSPGGSCAERVGYTNDAFGWLASLRKRRYRPRMWRRNRFARPTAALCLVATGALAVSCGPKTTDAGSAPEPAATDAQPEPPTVEISSVTLVSAPSNMSLAAHFCPIINEKFGPGRASVFCTEFEDAASAADAPYIFDVALDVSNPAGTQLVVVEAMVAFTAYPESSGVENMGAVCIPLCGDGESCAALAGGCGGADRVEPPATDLLASKTAAAPRTTVDPGEVDTIEIRLELSPSTMLEIMGTAALESLAPLDGRDAQPKLPKLSVPFRVAGTLWVRTESGAEAAVTFGPKRDLWALADAP